jgi:hypothetical protein
MLGVGTGSIRWPRPLSFSPGFKCNRYYIEMSSRYTKECIRVYKTRHMLGETLNHPHPNVDRGSWRLGCVVLTTTLTHRGRVNLTPLTIWFGVEAEKDRL